MNKTITSIFFALLIGSVLSTTLEGRRCYGRYNRGATAVGFFAGALAGAALSGAYNDCPYPYYGYGPRVIYAYDYPAFAYDPMYAYPNTLYTYPGYYFGY